MEFTLTENAFYSKRRLVGVNAFEVNTEKTNTDEGTTLFEL